MNHKLELILYRAAPTVLQQLHDDVIESCMGWGICCEDGWFEILYRLVRDLEQLGLEYPKAHVEALQIKEKYGDLCFYYSVEGDPESADYEIIERVARDLVRAAEQDASDTCEICGKQGAVNRCVNDWFQTLCEDCWKEQKKHTHWKESSDAKQL